MTLVAAPFDAGREGAERQSRRDSVRASSEAKSPTDLDPKKWSTLVTIWPCLLGARHAKALPRRASAPYL